MTEDTVSRPDPRSPPLVMPEYDQRRPELDRLRAIEEAARAMLEPVGHPRYREKARDGHTYGSIPSSDCNGCARIRSQRFAILRAALEGPPHD